MARCCERCEAIMRGRVTWGYISSAVLLWKGRWETIKVTKSICALNTSRFHSDPGDAPLDRSGLSDNNTWQRTNTASSRPHSKEVHPIEKKMWCNLIEVTNTKSLPLPRKWSFHSVCPSDYAKNTERVSTKFFGWVVTQGRTRWIFRLRFSLMLLICDLTNTSWNQNWDLKLLITRDAWNRSVLGMQLPEVISFLLWTSQHKHMVFCHSLNSFGYSRYEMSVYLSFCFAFLVWIVWRGGAWESTFTCTTEDQHRGGLSDDWSSCLEGSNWAASRDTQTHRTLRHTGHSETQDTQTHRHSDTQDTQRHRLRHRGTLRDTGLRHTGLRHTGHSDTQDSDTQDTQRHRTQTHRTLRHTGLRHTGHSETQDSDTQDTQRHRTQTHRTLRDTGLRHTGHSETRTDSQRHWVTWGTHWAEKLRKFNFGRLPEIEMCRVQ